MFSISKETLRINGEIRAREVRVTDAQGEQLGIMSTRDALRKAEEAHLDLVEVAPKAKPPVCRIMDFGKYRYEQQKREKEAKKKQKVISVKEVKLRPGIETHDFNFKVKNAMRFIAEGNKVKATIMFRGRELSHPEMGKELLLKVAEAMQEAVTVEREPKLEGKTRRAAAKRFTATGSGEFKRNKAFKSHILEKKSPKRKRNLRKAAIITAADHKRVSKMLPYA